MPAVSCRTMWCGRSNGLGTAETRRWGSRCCGALVARRRSSPFAATAARCARPAVAGRWRRARHLVDRVLPDVRVRQWVLSVPWPPATLDVLASLQRSAKRRARAPACVLGAAVGRVLRPGSRPHGCQLGWAVGRANASCPHKLLAAVSGAGGIHDDGFDDLTFGSASADVSSPGARSASTSGTSLSENFLQSGQSFSIGRRWRAGSTLTRD
jgi:hypothetical protein